MRTVRRVLDLPVDFLEPFDFASLAGFAFDLDLDLVETIFVFFFLSTVCFLDLDFVFETESGERLSGRTRGISPATAVNEKTLAKNRIAIRAFMHVLSAFYRDK